MSLTPTQINELVAEIEKALACEAIIGKCGCPPKTMPQPCMHDHAYEDAKRSAMRLLTPCLEALRQMQGAQVWKPIDDKAKDGRSILVCGGTFDYDGSYYAKGSLPEFTDVAQVRWNGLRDAFTAPMQDGHDNEYYYYPTHYMLLPSAIQSKQSTGEG